MRWRLAFHPRRRAHARGPSTGRVVVPHFSPSSSVHQIPTCETNQIAEQLCNANGYLYFGAAGIPVLQYQDKTIIGIPENKPSPLTTSPAHTTIFRVMRALGEGLRKPTVRQQGDKPLQRDCPPDQAGTRRNSPDGSRIAILGNRPNSPLPQGPPRGMRPPVHGKRP